MSLYPMGLCLWSNRGRKRMALLFCVTSSTASLIRLSSNYHYLIVSHLLSGLSTALLYCVFEAWYISQHQRKGMGEGWIKKIIISCVQLVYGGCASKHDDFIYAPMAWGTASSADLINNFFSPMFPCNKPIGFAPALIGATFSTAIFLNGLVAILAGIVANISVSWSGSLAAPFVVSAGSLILAGLMISNSWEENFGESKTNASGSVLKSMLEGLVVLKNGMRVSFFTFHFMFYDY